MANPFVVNKQGDYGDRCLQYEDRVMKIHHAMYLARCQTEYMVHVCAYSHEQLHCSCCLKCWVVIWLIEYHY